MENENEVPVAFIVAITGDGVVYLKRSDYDDIEPGKWCLPSGHVENGETHKDAAVRELYEETGIKAPGPCIATKLQLPPFLLPFNLNKSRRANI